MVAFRYREVMSQNLLAKMLQKRPKTIALASYRRNPLGLGLGYSLGPNASKSDKDEALRESKVFSRLMMFGLIESHLERIIDSDYMDDVRNDEQAFTGKLATTAHDFLVVLKSQTDVYFALAIMSKYGEGSNVQRVFKLLHTSAVQQTMNVLCTMFIACAFINDNDTRRHLSLALLVPISVEICLAFGLYRLAYGHWKNGWIPLLEWGLLLAAYVSPDLYSDKNFIMVEDLFRPFVLATRSADLICAITVLINCIMDVFGIFKFLFAFVAFTAIVINLLFQDLWDPVLGETANSFFETFVDSFVFLTSGENWDVFVYQGYRVSKMSHFLFVPLSLMGIFVLVSMVSSKLRLLHDSRAA